MKAPSCALFSPDGEFDSFGFEAEEKYTKLAEDGDHENWYFFRRFKMLLYENKVHTPVTYVYIHCIHVFSCMIKLFYLCSTPIIKCKIHLTRHANYFQEIEA